jgi:hypothetical protein
MTWKRRHENIQYFIPFHEKGKFHVLMNFMGFPRKLKARML